MLSTVIGTTSGHEIFRRKFHPEVLELTGRQVGIRLSALLDYLRCYEGAHNPDAIEVVIGFDDGLDEVLVSGALPGLIRLFQQSFEAGQVVIESIADAEALLTEGQGFTQSLEEAPAEANFEKYTASLKREVVPLLKALSLETSLTSFDKNSVDEVLRGVELLINLLEE